jgi:hypothetical protein
LITIHQEVIGYLVLLDTLITIHQEVMGYFVLLDLINEVCFPCCQALMKTEVRLVEFESRAVQTRDVVECFDLLENSPKRTEVFTSA